MTISDTRASFSNVEARTFLDGPSKRLLIGGEWVAAASGAELEVVDPSTEQVIARVAAARRGRRRPRRAGRADRVRIRSLVAFGAVRARQDPRQVGVVDRGAHRGTQPARVTEQRNVVADRARHDRRSSGHRAVLRFGCGADPRRHSAERAGVSSTTRFGIRSASAARSFRGTRRSRTSSGRRRPPSPRETCWCSSRPSRRR